VVIAASNVLRGVASGYVSLFLAVAVFGLGGPLVSVGAPKMAALWFEGRERGFAMGVYITGLSLGNIVAFSLTNSVLMPLFAGNWRAVLLADAGLGLVIGLIWLAITAHPVYRAVETRPAGQARESQLKMFGDLVRVPAVRWLLVISIGIFFFNHGLDNWLPEILRSRGMDAATAGFWATVPTAIGVTAALAIPRLATPSRRLPILIGLFGSAAGATLLLHGGEGTVLAGGLILQGVARGAMMAVAMLTLLEIPEVGPRRAGMAGGLFFAAAEIGGVLGPVAIGVIADFSGGFGAPLGVLTGSCLALIVMGLRLKRVLH
jgi:cyanate permease